MVPSWRRVLAAPAALPASDGAFVRVDVWAVDPRVPEWSAPVHAYFRRAAGSWILVGLDRGIPAATAN